MAHEGQETLLFVSEEGEHTCERCAGLNGKAFTLYELIEQELLPPLHPNGRCVLIPYDAAQYWDRESFGELTVVKEPEEIGWWTRALRNLLRVPSDAWEMLKGFGAAEAERLSRGDILDFITLGIVSGFIESFVERGKVMMDEPGLYTILNFLSLGFLETAEGAFLPEEPLSLEHLLDIAAVVTVVYGVAKTAKRAAAKQSKPAKVEAGGGKKKQLLIQRSNPGKYTEKIKWGIHDIEVRKEGKGFWGKRIEQNNPRVNAYELKINPQNESYYLPHPDGGFVQFENIVNYSTVQDGKLIMRQKSFYHINDMPDFAKNKVLQEAQRQITAANAAHYTVEWLVSDKNAVNQLSQL